MNFIDSPSQPHVGIFWIVQGELVINGIEVLKAQETHGIRDYEGDHFSFWEKWTKNERKDLARFAYDHFPRGRIVYDTKARIFCIYCDRCIITNQPVIERLITVMNLTGCSYRILPDVHYQCHLCNPDYVSDEDLTEDC